MIFWFKVEILNWVNQVVNLKLQVAYIVGNSDKIFWLTYFRLLIFRSSCSCIQFWMLAETLNHIFLGYRECKKNSWKIFARSFLTCWKKSFLIWQAGHSKSDGSWKGNKWPFVSLCLVLSGLLRGLICWCCFCHMSLFVFLSSPVPSQTTVLIWVLKLKKDAHGIKN